MGLFDGAIMEQASTADLAQVTGWPVVLIIDAAAQGASVGAVLRGFATHRPNFSPVGVIFNRMAVYVIRIFFGRSRNSRPAQM